MERSTCDSEFSLRLEPNEKDLRAASLETPWFHAEFDSFWSLFPAWIMTMHRTVKTRDGQVRTLWARMLVSEVNHNQLDVGWSAVTRGDHFGIGRCCGCIWERRKCNERPPFCTDLNCRTYQFQHVIFVPVVSFGMSILTVNNL
jgi:hypothetical protein